MAAEDCVRLYLINPYNPVVSVRKTGKNRLNRYRVWKPLGLLVIAGLTPKDWDVTVIDENLGEPDYSGMPKPDLAGITAFTSQAPRAYEIAALFRSMGTPVVMGGIHVTLRREEALQFADSIVTGEAESVWSRVLEDARHGRLERVYAGGLSSMDDVPAARHDLLAGNYHFGSLQTTRGCPLNCTFCSVTAFNGGVFRHRPIDNVIAEMRLIREKAILFVDDNLIGTRQDHIAYSKDLFRAIIREKLARPWICQATINFADDEELLELAARSGCQGVYIGFESPTVEGLIAIHKRFNIQNDRDFRASVRRIQRRRICVVGSFIAGIDTDTPGIGETIAQAAIQYGVDAANVLLLTPLPGTKLFTDMEQDGRIRAIDYPRDWQYYTLTYPVAEYRNFTWTELLEEVSLFNRRFYSYPRILSRMVQALRTTRNPKALLVRLIANLTYRANHKLEQRVSARRPESSIGEAGSPEMQGGFTPVSERAIPPGLYP